MKKTIRTIVMMVLVLAIITSTVGSVAAVSVGDNRKIKFNLRCKRNSDVGEEYSPNPFTDWYCLTYNGFLSSIRYYQVCDANGNPTSQVAYCIEWGKKNSTGLHNIQDITLSQAWKDLSFEQQEGIKRATLYGYPNNNYGVKNCDAYAATQIIIWEFQLGLRKLDGTVNSAFVDTITAFDSSPAKIAYNAISNAIATHKNIPSIAGANVTAKYNTATKKWEASLTDNNGYLSAFSQVGADSDVSVSINGNTLTMTSDHYFNTKTLSFFKRSVPNGGNQPLLIMYSEGHQSLVTGSMPDPVKFSVTISAEKKGSARLTKTATEDGKPIAGALYGLFKTDGTKIAEGTTDANGVVSFDGVDQGNYYLQELQAPKGRVLDSKKIELSVTAGQTTNVTANNAEQLGVISLIKRGEVLTGFTETETDFGTQYTPVYEEQGLQGAQFAVLAKEDIVVNGELKHKAGERIETLTTGENGKVQSSKLHLGKYTVVEEKAPEGFYLDTDNAAFEVELEYQGQTVEVFSKSYSITNDRQRININFIKSIEENEQYPNADAYKDITFGIFTREPIMQGEKVMLEQDCLVDVISINALGQALSNTDLPFGKYYLKEIKTAVGLQINEAEFDFEFKYSEQSVSLQRIHINGLYGEITNQVIRADVEIIKTSTFDKRTLEGAVYGIYRASDDELVAEMTTDENGYAKHENLPYGDYYLKEITPPVHFHLDETKYEFSVDGKKEVISIDVYNDPIIGAIMATYEEKGYKEALDETQFDKPATGDNSPLMIYVSILCISVPVLVASIKELKRKNAKLD